MRNVIYILVVMLVITSVVYLVSPGGKQDAFKKAAWIFCQMFGGFLALALVVNYLTL
jgi:hypothetical protein